MTDCSSGETKVPNSTNNEAYTPIYVFDGDRKAVKTIDGSVQADIVVNADDKTALNEEGEAGAETKKLLDEDRETKREMLYRQARVLYPETEEWILSLAVDAFMQQEEKGIDITTHKFTENAEKY
jgi:phage major head subunit gpT-like protein